MSLREKIQKDLNMALKTKNEVALLALRMLSAAILNKKKEKRYKIIKEKPELTEAELEKESRLSDLEIIETIYSEIKKRKEAQLMFEQGQRKDLAEKEKREAEILQKYLPEQLSDEEIRKIAREMIEDVGAKGEKDMGRVMKILIPRLKGGVEGGRVSHIVKELLA